MAKSNPTNIQVYRKKPYYNIGIVVFGVILIYLIITVLSYLTQKHVTAYEVREGSILKDTAYTGLALRSEKVVNAKNSGYVNYFSAEGSKVGAKTKVYTLSGQKLDFKEKLSEEEGELSAEEEASVLLKTQSFSENFKDDEFRDVYSLKSNIDTILESKSSQSRQAQLNEMLESNKNDIEVFKGTSDGIIQYSTDGFESLKSSEVTEDMLSKKGYNLRTMTNNMKVEAGDPVYKLITEDTWTLVIQLNDSTAQEMADTKRVRVRFSKDNETETADFTIYNTPDANFGFLTFDKAMIRYAQERYLDVELILEDESGLKIPKSAVVNKSFYLVPGDYITQGGNSKETGVLLDNGDDPASFQKVDVYFQDQETDMVYLDTQVFDENQMLVKPESSETYTLGKTGKLKGVYNINKGYAVFKQIEILCESDEYYIVKEGNDYSLANYDHIALNGSYVKENDVVF